MQVVLYVIVANFSNHIFSKKCINIILLSKVNNNGLYAFDHVIYHCAYTRSVMCAHPFSNLAFHPLFCPLDTPPSSALHRAFLFHPLFLYSFIVARFSFLRNQPHSVYTQCAYTLQPVVKHRTFPSPASLSLSHRPLSNKRLSPPSSINVIKVSVVTRIG